MDGRLLHFDDATQRGEVEDARGQRHPFALAQWRGRGLPRVGTAVRFELRDGEAIQVFDRPRTQPRATTTRSADGQTLRKQLSHWCLAALAVSLAGIGAGRYAPIVEVVAVLLAWWGLRHVHRAPQRLMGYSLAALAIVIAVGVTLWSQW